MSRTLIAGNPALPNAAAPNPSLACVLTTVAALAERQRRIVDRYLPHLIKLLSRLTHELNSASANGTAPPPHPLIPPTPRPSTPHPPTPSPLTPSRPQPLAHHSLTLSPLNSLTPSPLGPTLPHMWCVPSDY